MCCLKRLNMQNVHYLECLAISLKYALTQMFLSHGNLSSHSLKYISD